MKLYAKLLLGFGSLWAVFLLATAMVMVALQHNGTVLEAAFHSNFDSVVYGDQMKTSLEALNRIALNYVWHHTPVQAPEVDKLWADYRAGKEGQAHNITLPGEAELTSRLFDAGDKYYQDVSTFMHQPASDPAHTYREDLLDRYLRARGAAQAVIDLNLNHLLMVESQLRSNLAWVRDVQILFVVAGAALALVSVWVLTKTILGPLRVLTNSANQIEAGNLDLVIPVKSHDELGELAAAFDKMAVKLREYRSIDHARLLRTQQTTQLAIDSLPDAVAVFDPAGEVEISNQQARHHFGLIPGAKLSDARLEWLSRLFEESLATGHPVEPSGYRSAIQLFDNGDERFLLPRAVPMFGDRRQVIGIAVILVDVTRLHRADELKSGLVSIVSHELRTPLAATRFSVHLLAQESVSPLSDPQRRLVAAACDGADRLHRVIENLLQFQRIEEGQYSIATRQMTPAQIVEPVVALLAKDFESAGLQLAVELPASLPAVFADPELIGYVVSNLLTNALKFVPRGGHVQITATTDDSGREVLFFIRDDGPGIPEEHLPRLFHRYHRAGAPKEIPGAGLGLAIARQLVQAHGGRIEAHRRQGGGMEFAFALHASAPHPDTLQK